MFSRLFISMAFFASASASAHPVSLTQSFVYVTRGGLTAKVDVYLEDLFLFHNLSPNDLDFFEPTVIESGVEKHKQFLLERFVIRDIAGQRLDGRLVDVKTDHLPAEGVKFGELMAHKLTFQFEYELPSEPEFLTFSQHFVDDNQQVPAEMHVFVKQENSGEPLSATLQADEAETFRFSWNNPALSPEASQEERKKWAAKQKEETLGITSYSSVYSFLYVDDFEVRHEILVPLLTLEESVLIARDDDPFLDIPEQDAARKQIEAFFKSGNPIEIDGVRVKPTVQRCDFYGLDFKDFALRPDRRSVSISNARIGIILSYEADDTPGKVRVTWNRFNNYIWSVNMVVYAFDAARKVTLSRVGKNNFYEWNNPGRPAVSSIVETEFSPSVRPTFSIPVVSAICLTLLLFVVIVLWRFGASGRRYVVSTAVLGVCAAATWPVSRWETPNPFSPSPTVTNDEADAIFQSLHQNTYRAFAYRKENDIYDALAKCVDGELLNDLYLQIRRGLQMQEQGGAVSRIQEVEILDGKKIQEIESDSTNDQGFKYHCRWTVTGTVEHWGHIHARTNQYQARFMVEPRGEAWKIIAVELLGEERVKFETNVREL